MRSRKGIGGSVNQQLLRNSTTKLWNLKHCFSLMTIISLGVIILAISHFNSAKVLFQTMSKLHPLSSEWKESVRRRPMMIQSIYNSTWNRSLESSVGNGYIVVSQYSDQMTGASFSVLSLQCWAGAVSKDIKIAEPFMFKGSGFGYTVDNLKNAKMGKQQEKDKEIKLGDIFNLDKWQQQLDSRGYPNAPIVEWTSFLNTASRNLIIVKSGCSKVTCDSFETFTTNFASHYNFKVIRSIHLQKIKYSFNKFVKVIYDTWNPSNTVVLFQYWGGMQPVSHDKRYYVTGMDRCSRNASQEFLFEFSNKILEDSKKYTAKYIPEQGTKYIAVMLRTEKFGLSFFKNTSFIDKMALFTNCIESIEREVHSMQRLHNTSDLFLAVDSRKQGSRRLRSGKGRRFMNSTLVNTMTTMFFETLHKYGNKLTMEEWDASFENISSFQVPGYIAQLQKNLAAGGKCLVTAGGGNFQRTARLLYSSRHRSDTGCVVDVCT